MNFLVNKLDKQHMIGLPKTREVSIVGQVWPYESSPIYRDLRFHFHSKNPRMEVCLVRDLLNKYTKTVELNPSTNHIKCIIETALVPHVQKKCEELGLNINWLTIRI